MMMLLRMREVMPSNGDKDDGRMMKRLNEGGLESILNMRANTEQQHS